MHLDPYNISMRIKKWPILLEVSNYFNLIILRDFYCLRDFIFYQNLENCIVQTFVPEMCIAHSAT
jgi:hypothetical protein